MQCLCELHHKWFLQPWYQPQTPKGLPLKAWAELSLIRFIQDISSLDKLISESEKNPTKPQKTCSGNLFSVEVIDKKIILACYKISISLGLFLTVSVIVQLIQLNNLFSITTLLCSSVIVGGQLLSQPAEAGLRITAERKNYIYASFTSHLGHNK